MREAIAAGADLATSPVEARRPPFSTGVARVFFVWVSVFNLFAIAVFCSFMADLFTAKQGKRLFGFIGAGGTAGGLLGPVITIWLSVPLGPVNLLMAAAVLLEASQAC